MNKSLHYLKWLLPLLLFPVTVMAQFTATGKITEIRTNEPVIGATVLVKGRWLWHNTRFYFFS